MQSKLLVICGPTATGKTSLGIKLAKKFNGEIISADSRQVFRGMDIGTGKEWSEEVNIWGYDLVSPKDEFSVSLFLDFAKEKVEEILSMGKLPIIVGGTGFYIKAVIDGIETVTVPQNKSLRVSLESKDKVELFEILGNIDPLRAGNLNHSDKNNPRRLVRAIEVAQFMIDQPSLKFQPASSNFDFYQIGLTTSVKKLEKRIEERVEKRVKMGMKMEVKKLIDSGVDWSMQSMFSLGYRQYRDYFEGGVSEDLIADEWFREEVKYVKRQITWFKKDKRIKWFDIGSPTFPKDVENVVKLWHEKG